MGIYIPLFISKLLKLLDPEFVLMCGSCSYTTRGNSLLEEVSVSGVVLCAQHRWFPGGRDASLPAWTEPGAGTTALTDWWTQQPPSRALVSLQQAWLGVGKLDKPRDLLWGMVRCCWFCCCCPLISASQPAYHSTHPSSLLSLRPDASSLMNLEQFANRWFWLD